MGNILIWLILLVTIPRWAATLAQVDKYMALGIPITAIGEGIVLELGCWYIIRIFSATRAKAFAYRAWWEAHDGAMRDQGKRNRKPQNDPQLRGYQVLMVAFAGLLLLTLLAQTPFIMTQLSGGMVATLLTENLLWAYSIVLVVSPELMTAAIAVAIHYHGVVRADEGALPLGEWLQNTIGKWTAQKPARTAQPATQPVAAIAGDNGHQSHACPYCDRHFAKSQSLSAHLKHCDAYQTHKAQEVAQ